MPKLNSVPAPLATAAPGEAEQRQHHRHLCIDGGVVRLAVRPAYRGQRAVLVDISAGGLGLLLGEPIEVGAVLAFDLWLPQGADARGRVARVRHCTSHPAPAEAPWRTRRLLVPRLLRRLVGLAEPATGGRAWMVGCEFSRPLEPGELAETLRLLGLDQPASPR
jgi:hypothetical protein